MFLSILKKKKDTRWVFSRGVPVFHRHLTENSVKINLYSVDLFSSAEGFLYIAFHAFISRKLDNNEMIELPEKVFSGLSSLRQL